MRLIHSPSTQEGKTRKKEKVIEAPKDEALRLVPVSYTHLTLPTRRTV